LPADAGLPGCSRAIGALRLLREVSVMRSNLTQSFMPDQRGAVLVLGLMFGVFLVGALFHLASVAHAITWRELLQDAGDSVAYESAVWNAKGMNIIVGLNILIAMVMAVLIAWRLVLAFLGAVLALAVVVCLASFLFPVFAPVCGAVPTLQTAMQTMLRLDTRVQQNVYRIINLTHVGQRTVASGMPVVSLTVSTIHLRKDYPVDFGMVMGAPLMPATALDAMGQAQDAAEKKAEGVLFPFGGK
jgi:hypothetical protein